MSATDWDKEMAKIDKHLESIPNEDVAPHPAPVLPAGAPPAATAPVAPAPEPALPRGTSAVGVFFRLVLTVTLGVAMLFWPYSARCGVGLFAYIGAVIVLTAAGVWSGIWTWRHRAGQAHVLALLIVLWGLVLGGLEVLPRTGYALPSVAHPAIWMCE